MKQNRINYLEMRSKEKHNDNNIQRQNKKYLGRKKHFQITLSKDARGNRICTRIYINVTKSVFKLK